MSAARQLEEAGPRCAVCAAPMALSATGRPRKYCSSRCKQKSVRNRRIIAQITVALQSFTAKEPERIDWSDEEHRVT